MQRSIKHRVLFALNLFRSPRARWMDASRSHDSLIERNAAKAVASVTNAGYAARPSSRPGRSVLVFVLTAAASALVVALSQLLS
jgi:hypothetical protein